MPSWAPDPFGGYENRRYFYPGGVATTGRHVFAMMCMPRLVELAINGEDGGGGH